MEWPDIMLQLATLVDIFNLYIQLLEVYGHNCKIENKGDIGNEMH